MKDATLKQAVKILTLVEQKEVSSEQLQKLLGSGLLTDLLDCPNPELVDREAFQLVIKNPKKESILEFIGTVTVPARTGKFVAKDHFIMDTGKKAKVKIFYLGDNFRKNLLNKIEEAISETTLCSHWFKKSSRDILIISELGGDDKAETSLSEMFSLMEKQPNGEKGDLLVNGCANIFYIRGRAGVLWAVGCDWYGVGWNVRAGSVGDPLGWDGGDRVFSRNS